MADVGRCLADGFSTAGYARQRPGRHRAASARRSTSTPAPGTGTAPGRRLWAGPGRSARRPRLWRSAAVCRAQARRRGLRRRLGVGRATDGASLVLVADGLGHGPLARRAAARGRPGLPRGGRRGAGRDRCEPPTPPCGARRGAASAVAESTSAARTRPLRGGRQHRRARSWAATRAASDGLAQRHRRPRGAQDPGVHLPLAARAPLLVLHSDGLASHWDLESLSRAGRARHPALIAGVLYRDFKRGRDDVTVVVVGDRWTGR